MVAGSSPARPTNKSEVSHYLWRLGRLGRAVHTGVVPAHGGVYAARANTRYLPRFLRLGAAVLLARRPTLVLPLARAALANFARAAACFLVAIGVFLSVGGAAGAGSLAYNPSTRPGDRLGYGALRPSVAVAVRGGAGSCATGHAASGLSAPARGPRPCRHVASMIAGGCPGVSLSCW